ncbi:MAG: hypothetical protein UT42_C0019G0003 [Candidatus Falkowbacteria bacterium GW2011_GWA2_39_24]|uniref:Uncharacterized protein n=1 Tax=Candidatus Falkowbacteria bacterium GW2011_GWA2_39_24 TaxID=1618634 RepID=A0A0G0RMC8_9BACT|nr:MAG: hypothetical protein UT42_C0019G0003 [Candidatus Falkowbacteria bacterium GW2011_GWA2_39_24]
MKDNNLKGFPEVMKRLGEVFSKDLPGKPLLRANLKYAATSVTISIIAAWLLGWNVWVILAALFLQSIYFFGQKTTHNMFVFLFVDLSILLVCGLAYNVLIQQTGLEEEWSSSYRHTVTKIGIDLDRPTDSLEARMQKLIRERADKLYQENQGDFEGLLKASQEIKKMKKKMYNSVNDKDSYQEVIETTVKTTNRGKANNTTKVKGVKYASIELQPGQTSQVITVGNGKNYIIYPVHQVGPVDINYNGQGKATFDLGSGQAAPHGVLYFTLTAIDKPVSAQVAVWPRGMSTPPPLEL